MSPTLSSGNWSQSDTVLTLQPTSELLYASGVNPTARIYTITVLTSAADKAGNQIAAQSVTNFATLRRVETVVELVDQKQYFLADGEYVNNASNTFYVRRQIGGNGWEDQWDYGLVAFNEADTNLANAINSADSSVLELYASSSPSDATLNIKHVHSSNLSSLSTPTAAAVTTSVNLSSFPAASTWWAIDVSTIFEHSNFNLSSYTNGLQFVLTLSIPGSPSAGTSKQVTFGGGNSANYKPRLRFTSIVP